MNAKSRILGWVVVALGVFGPGCGDDDAVVDAGSDAALDAPLDAGADAGPGCDFTDEAEVLPDPARHTPRWAFEPWISKDISDRADTEAFVAGFLDRGIPVGAVVLDSPWETSYNTLIPNPERYGDFQSLVDDLHAQDIRLVLWTTQMINLTSFDAEVGGDAYRGPASNYLEGKACGFYVNDGRLYPWWKGRGAALDFFNPVAAEWWRRQQDDLLAMGVDGWKLDFGESYIRDAPNSYDDTIDTADGVHTLQEYSELYYADFLRYGVHRSGREFVTMVRPYDVSYDVPARFYARPEHAPVAWTGDNHRNWDGLVDALDHTFRSAQAGYVVIGSDIGGYLDRDQDDLLVTIPFDQEVFARWVAMSGMMPFFQLHGRANLEPWNIEERTEETIALYRYWATLHHEMVPFWYSLSEDAYAASDTVVHPIGAGVDEWAGDWRYLVGDTILVAPVLEAGGVRDVELPSGSWYDWWSGEAVAGGTTLAAYAGATDQARIPIFVREGAVVPMEIDSDVTGFGNAASAGHLTIASWLPSVGAGDSSFTLHREGATDADDSTAALVAEPRGFAIQGAAADERFLLRLRVALGVAEVVTGVTIDGSAATPHVDRAAFDAAATGWFVDADGLLWVKLDAGAPDRTVVLQTT